MNSGESSPDDGVGLDRVRGATSVLVLAPEMENAVERVCTKLLHPASPAERNVVKISYHFSQPELAERWQQKNLASSTTVHCMSVSDSSVEESPPDSDKFSFTSARPGDLTGTGMKINQIIGEVDTETTTTLICLDSLDSMLMYNDAQTVYRFVRTISNLLATNNGQVHFHLDPAQHDEIVNTLKSAFNAIVEVDEESIMDIKTR